VCSRSLSSHAICVPLIRFTWTMNSRISIRSLLDNGFHGSISCCPVASNCSTILAFLRRTSLDALAPFAPIQRTCCRQLINHKAFFCSILLWLPLLGSRFPAFIIAYAVCNHDERIQNGRQYGGLSTTLVVPMIHMSSSLSCSYRHRVCFGLHDLHLLQERFHRNQYKLIPSTNVVNSGERT